MKSADPAEPYRLAESGPPFDSGHPNGLTIDVTNLDPTDAASQVLGHAVGDEPS